MRRNDRGLSRREVLRIGVLGALGAFVAACQRAVEPITGVSAPAAAPTKELNAKGAPPVAVAAGDGVPVTANADFYTVWYGTGGVPQPPANWKLTITGVGTVSIS